jgi:very-short-patch-repair endonuclease
MGGYERSLWHLIRASRMGFKFRRQYPVEGYTLDFYCAAARLCIEVDGPYHALRSDSDLRRDQRLAELGIETLRIELHELEGDADKLCNRIRDLCEARTGVRED